MKKFIDICQASLVLFGMMICGLFIAGLSVYVFEDTPKSEAAQWVMFSAQNIFAFILPAVLTWKICFKNNPLRLMGATSMPSVRMIGIAIAVYLIGIPALNQIVYWNQEVVLPDAFASFEQWCRETEERAAAETAIILNVDSVWQMLMNILVIGVLTGIGEEFFFRGGLQKILLHCGVRQHVAIWSAAIVFSALHFQFYGFVPRVLLGAWFGYLYCWSGNIWVSSLAHAINNSIVIVSQWLVNKELISEDFDMFGVTENAFPFAFLVSGVLVGLALYFCHKKGWLPAQSKDMTSSLKNSKV